MALQAVGPKQAPAGCLCSTHCNEADSEVYHQKELFSLNLGGPPAKSSMKPIMDITVFIPVGFYLTRASSSKASSS